ncbi:MAG TPA: NAD-dependent epimerase/dehydratase family protein [Planctomycetota bacterium]|nr:NAD-dependent epimerase/dehydratase family protein [Planctomycetota bacterium]
MAVALITGSSGLIGSESARFFHAKGLDVVGIDNGMRKYFFGPDGDTAWNTQQLTKALKNFRHEAVDIRDREGLQKVFSSLGKKIEVVIHTAAQPSHDWAAREPFTDFSINANGTLEMLEATRKFCPNAVFVFTSTNKVYGDAPNTLPLVELDSRWELSQKHPWHKHGIDETMSIDQSKHSLFGASKVAADVLVQEYGRYFGMKTGVFRGGCLTGPAHSAAELHGFLAYLVKCALTGKPYTIFGYKGKQVRDNIHAYDLVNAFWHFFKTPKSGAVYNMGGSRHSNCSVLEAAQMVEKLTGKALKYEVVDQARSGDHIWWISDVRKFQKDHRAWKYKYDLKMIMEEIIEGTQERLRAK